MQGVTNVVELKRIEGVRTGPNGSAEIIGTQQGDFRTIVKIAAADLSAIAAPLICIGALNASPSPPTAGTPVLRCHLPVMSWQTARTKINREPL
jgi:hypothetical protein